METRLIVMDEAASTQDVVREAAERGEPEGLAVMALVQTRGRGRFGRSWISPHGRNLALSLLLRPKLEPRDAAVLGMMLSIPAAEIVEEHGVRIARLRWPNDVIVNEKKIAGILPEARVTGSAVEYVILGIGININARLADFPPDLRGSVTSLLVETGHESDLDSVARGLLVRTERIYDRVTKEGTRFVLDLWQARWAHRGAVLVRDRLVGRAEGLDADGALLLRTDEGGLHRIHAGEALPL